MSEERTLPVPDGLAGERVDVGVSRLFGLSRTRAAELVMAGEVTIDGAVPARSTRLEAGALLTAVIPPARPAAQIHAGVVEGMSIVFEDDHIVVVDKPVGVAAHPSVGWTGPTVLGHLAGANIRISTSGAPERKGIVQRLDVGTSGLMVVAKSERAYSVLKDAFRRRTVSKTYHAVCQGHPDPLRGTIEAPIGRSPHHDYKYAVMSTGKHAVTHYEVEEMFRSAALLEIHLETGRTHQIRVHFSAMRHPLVGDPLYGSDPTIAARLGLERQWLHAVELSFEHPISREQVTFTSSYPEDLAEALRILREG
ncbi:RluA family pseudouridine synthase [Brachybacterium phenoliresistens]|uniref:Pseudouridine synthase n=1 Tax=Brachybacterium phenoliresistens TaxID=396014 RepID=Z9JRR7_9MICO|nr:RluA family pseudouridine synthase [Brachybacterium phenoliresistens]EWS80723.1 pseudouridine synthase [Brachybacterium phenoliresistens]